MHKIAGAFGDQLNGHRRYWRDGLLDGTEVVDRRRAHPHEPGGRGHRARRRRRRTRSSSRAPSTRERPDVVVVLVAKPSIKLLENALRSGARDVVAPDATDDDLRTRVRQRARRRRPPAGRSRRRRRRRRRAGTSSASCRRRAARARRRCRPTSRPSLALAAPGEVVIVDLDFQFGDVASALRMTPAHTFADISRGRRCASTSRRSRSS